MSVELSVNYSLEAVKLLRERRISFDRLKCPDWPDLIAEAKKHLPVYVHFPLDAGSTSGRSPDFARALAMADETETPPINIHLVTWQRDFPEYAADSDDPRLRQQVIDRMIADVSAAASIIPRERLILENIPYFGARGEFHRASVEADVIRHVVEETNTGFLLDLSHARIAAHYLGVEPHAYVESLPVGRLRELHVTGVRMINDRLADHMELRYEDWAWTQWAFDRIKSGAWPTPWTVALEYGGIGEPFKWRSEEAAIAAMVPRLHEMIRTGDK